MMDLQGCNHGALVMNKWYLPLVEQSNRCNNSSSPARSRVKPGRCRESRLELGREALDPTHDLAARVPTDVAAREVASARERQGDVEARVVQEVDALLEAAELGRLERPGAASREEDHAPVQAAVELHPGRRVAATGQILHLQLQELKPTRRGRAAAVLGGGEVAHDHQQLPAGLHQVAAHGRRARRRCVGSPLHPVGPPGHREGERAGGALLHEHRDRLVAGDGVEPPHDFAVVVEDVLEPVHGLRGHPMAVHRGPDEGEVGHAADERGGDAGPRGGRRRERHRADDEAGRDAVPGDPHPVGGAHAREKTLTSAYARQPLAATASQPLGWEPQRRAPWAPERRRRAEPASGLTKQGAPADGRRRSHGSCGGGVPAEARARAAERQERQTAAKQRRSRKTTPRSSDGSSDHDAAIGARSDDAEDGKTETGKTLQCKKQRGMRSAQWNSLYLRG
ncbi:LOW QUALITY PROTEIN: hypothetical protein SETIT_5G252300v2 [Setaria italica]|uniref:Uncharacterized protein n=1 Tax=Setaria italica TaxID=4555 RepID=A0A368R8R1_SETIT|nr:LOW QUALITY PROTEIN: hypothetical protein SETIT_5G252300v2 [Setaria italica]